MMFAWFKRSAPRSLYGRAALILLTPIIAIQLVVAIVFIKRHYEDVTEQMTRSVALELRLLVDRIDRAPNAPSALGDVNALARALQLDIALPSAMADQDGDSRQFYDLSGRIVIATLRENLPGIDAIDLADADGGVAMIVTTRHGPLSIGFSRSRVSASNPHQLLVLMVGVSLLMTVIAYLFLRNQVRPIHRLAQVAEAFGRGQTVPYRPGGATEVRAAGQAFVEMRNRIERQIEQRTVMLSGVSHDLRTPLTRLKLGLSMLEDHPDRDELLGDVRDMEAMLDTFLDFARLDSLDDPASLDPSALLASIAHGATRAGQNITVRHDAGSEHVVLRPMAVRRALENLIGNGARHGSNVVLSCKVTDRAVVFSVEDDGPGIDPAVRDEALKPFIRLDAARNQNRGGSVGLGLSIAMDIARQHGGLLRLGESETLGGLRADLVLGR